MRRGTIINHEIRLKEKIRSIFRTAKHFHLSSKDLDNMYSKLILQDDGYKRLPRYSRSYLQGYADVLREDHWKNVKWVLPYNGTLYDCFSNLPEEGKKLYRTGKVSGIHVYIDNPHKHFTGSKDSFLIGTKEKRNEE